MFDKLINLQKKGYIPDIIFDIGAHHGDWTRECLKIYPKSRYVLIEPIEYTELNDLKKIFNIRIFNCILNYTNKEVDWYELKNTGDSIFRERGKSFQNCNIIKKNSITLNSLLESKKGIIENCQKMLIKIDCQGAEIPILIGSTDIYNSVDFIILELPLFGQYNENVPTFLEHIKFMDDIGFIPYEFLENHYVNNYNMQIDMLFINKNHEFNKIVEDLFIK
jgi:FkbM family methyltransferase